MDQGGGSSFIDSRQHRHTGTTASWLLCQHSGHRRRTAGGFCWPNCRWCAVPVESEPMPAPAAAHRQLQRLLKGRRTARDTICWHNRPELIQNHCGVPCMFLAAPCTELLPATWIIPVDPNQTVNSGDLVVQYIHTTSYIHTTYIHTTYIIHTCMWWSLASSLSRSH
jgi:hypothetical protein